MRPETHQKLMHGIQNNANTMETAYKGGLGTGYSCLLYPLSLLLVVQLTGPDRPGERNMRAN